ncbi:hypothetical protein [Methanobrevibacter sp. V74]|uniref:hypothetical protein n=2 Tax=unclassified Methanobrevibacter TaxID=2638681 RepID=UPI002733E6D0|nr:hypothetical protein [Methanobrevibacter sp. V74]
MVPIRVNFQAWNEMMIFEELLNHFEIRETFPNYLLNQTFNDVFLEGDITKKDNIYEITVTTRQDLTHMMFIKPREEFPVVIMSILPNGLLNGMKFGQNKGDEIPINKL